VRRAILFLAVVGGLTAVLISLFAYADFATENSGVRLYRLQSDLVRQLQLTDLSLWTEARYTRHPSQSDHFSPFQEFPGAGEHFPAGSILAPPPQTRTGNK